MIGETDKIRPAYSVCFYHGTEPWNGPRSLRDMMNFNGAESDWVEHFQNYGMNLFCANEVNDYSMFHTGLRQLLQVIPHRKNKEKLYEVFKKEEFRSLDRDTVETIAILTDATEVLERMDAYEVKGGYDMCQAMDALLVPEEDRENYLAKL